MFIINVTFFLPQKLDTHQETVCSLLWEIPAAFSPVPYVVKEAFIGTGAVAMVVVDIKRLAVYGAGFRSSHFGAIRADMCPSWLCRPHERLSAHISCKRPIGKITVVFVQKIIGAVLMTPGV